MFGVFELDGLSVSFIVFLGVLLIGILIGGVAMCKVSIDAKNKFAKELAKRPDLIDKFTELVSRWDHNSIDIQVGSVGEYLAIKNDLRNLALPILEKMDLAEVLLVEQGLDQRCMTGRMDYIRSILRLVENYESYGRNNG